MLSAEFVKQSMVILSFRYLSNLQYILKPVSTNSDFLGKLDQFWANILYVRQFFGAKSLQKTCLMFMRNYKEFFPSEFAKNYSLFDLMD